MFTGTHLLELLLQGAAGVFFHRKRLVGDANDPLIGAKFARLDIDLSEAACFEVLKV